MTKRNILLRYNTSLVSTSRWELLWFASFKRKCTSSFHSMHYPSRVYRGIHYITENNSTPEYYIAFFPSQILKLSGTLNILHSSYDFKFFQTTYAAFFVHKFNDPFWRTCSHLNLETIANSLLPLSHVHSMSGIAAQSSTTLWHRPEGIQLPWFYVGRSRAHTTPSFFKTMERIFFRKQRTTLTKNVYRIKHDECRDRSRW